MKPKIPILFRGPSVMFFNICEGIPVRLVGIIDYEGTAIALQAFYGYYRDYNKTIVP